MRKIYQLLFLFAIVFLVAGCSEKSQSNDDAEVSSPPMTYDANSWKTTIEDSCLSFFDGCNNCRRSAKGEMAACTRKACIKYKESRCLDDEK